LQSIVSEHGAQFRGNAQHDALEFLLWLLDRLHEDLGSGSPAPQPRRRDKVGARGAKQQLHLPPCIHAHGGARRPPRRLSSRRSSLTCPHCRKQSNTFDPFLCVSLPIPPRQTRPLNVTLVFQCKSQRFVRVGLAVPLLSTVARLREMVAAEGRIPPEQVILAEVCPAGFRRSFSDEEQLSAIAEGASVYAFQPPLPLGRGGSLRLAGTAGPSRPRAGGGGTGPAGGGGGGRLPPAALSSECLHRGAGGRVLLLLCNTAGAGPQATRFGPPLVMREDRGISWEQLQQCILAKMRYLMRSEVQPQGAGALFRIRVAGSSVACSYLSPQDARPLCHPAVDRALQLGGPGGPPHVKLTVEWDAGTKERLFGSIQEEVVQDAESVRLQQQAHQQQHSCTLDECFQLYTKEEQVWGRVH
ncbi:UBP43 hydrolase, partial [Dromaius novaehollandiae]|nr:UBP43 hydrolase [Dromaius novaehollandiae]